MKSFRILTAVAPYDGHDASILALNKALRAGKQPVDVIYLGYNMTGEQICSAAIQEGADAVAVSSYNGGHLQFFPHLARLLHGKGAEDVLIFGGGGGTILPEDAKEIETKGIEKIYGPDWSLDAVAEDMTARIKSRKAKTTGRFDPAHVPPNSLSDPTLLAELLVFVAERYAAGLTEKDIQWFAQLSGKEDSSASKVVIFTGDGGSGKSTIIDEFVTRTLEVFGDKKLAILANDPTTSKAGIPSSLLADRVRMNAIYDPGVFMHSVATGSPYAPVNPALETLVKILRAAAFDLILVETPGTGQAGLDLKNLRADLTVYVKTREFGTGLQLEKDQLLLDADLIALNKADQEGAETAYKAIGTYLAAQGRQADLHGLVAKVSRDPGMDGLFADVCRRLSWPVAGRKEEQDIFQYAKRASLVPHDRRAYLADIVKKINDYDAWTEEQVGLVREDPHNLGRLDPACAAALTEWPAIWSQLSVQAAKEQGISPEIITPNGLRLPRIALPNPDHGAESLRFLLQEGLPGKFPFATGIHPYRTRTSGETTRQFAGLRGPEETNRRLHLLARDVPKPRLSIAFDGITLYGADSDDDPGSIGKIGEGGVSIDTYEDMKLLLKGFAIPDISTSMTINGPAPIILAMYFNAALELEQERTAMQLGRALTPAEQDDLRKRTSSTLRGTVQADILKEMQAQNECIFQAEFSVKLLGDIQQWFIDNQVRKFYSLSISGYHIGEAGASPIQEMAFTLANGFTYVENYLARGMAIDDFAPSLSFFLRVSHEAEWLAYGAVCRKIWAIAMRDVYGGGERSQLFKFHTQTSGRALQTAEWDTLNPLRLTYHALMALLANTNSLHIDSADEPMTTPGEKWVRQATMIPNYLREEAEGFLIQNLLSGSYGFRELMRQVQQGILDEFSKLDQLGGVGPATEQGYQRRCIAEHSARYELERHRGAGIGAQKPLRPIIGYNVYSLPHGHPDKYPPVTEVIRPSPQDWEKQIARVRRFREGHRKDASQYLQRLKEVALRDGNIFAELLETVQHATLGQITRTLFEVGGRYRKMV